MIPDEVLRQIALHARDKYPAECCGLLLGDAAGTLRFQPIANIAGSQAGAATSARTQRDGYVMDPKELLAALETSERSGGSLWAIVHSHPDVGAYFSKEDRNMALGGGSAPLWPGVHYLVVSVRRDGVDDAKLYTWDAGKEDFLEQEVRAIASVS